MCKKEKNVSEFDKKRHRKRGYHSWCKECLAKYHAKLNLSIKCETFEAYGGAKCHCCGEDRIPFLTLGHVNDDGADHRESLGLERHHGGVTFYKVLRNKGFPKDVDLVVECLNCNCRTDRYRYDYCPHKQEDSKIYTGTGWF